MSLCDCNQGRLPCTCKTTEEEKAMKEVHRYKVVTMLSQAGATIGYDPHGPDVVMADALDRITAERDALQERLNAADQEKDDLSFQLNDREASRYSWFQAAQAAENRVEELEGLLRHIRNTTAGPAHRQQIDAALSASAEPQKPKFGVLAGEPEVLGERCSDGGTCHHRCESTCFRKDCCVPLSGAGLNDDWSIPGTLDKSTEGGAHEE